MKPFLYTALLCVACCGSAFAADKPHITKHPAAATYAKGAPARFYVNAYSPDGGYLTYQWYQKDFAYLSLPANGVEYTDAEKTYLKLNATPLPKSVTATLATTTPNEDTKYCFYWVKIKNTKDGVTDSIESEFAIAKIVDRALPDHITNSDFSTVYAPIGSEKFVWSNAGSNVDGRYTIVAQDRLPNWKTTDYYSTQSNVSNFGDVRQSFQVFCLDKKPFGYTVDSSNDFVADPETPTPITCDPTSATNVGDGEEHFYVTAKHGNKGGDTGNFGAIELANSAPSSVYQEIATVPGKIYEWSLDHVMRNKADNNDVMAVVMGAAMNEQAELGKDQNLWENDSIDELLYPYGASSNISPENSPTYFYNIIKELARIKNTTPAGLAEYKGTAFVQPYNDHLYYIKIFSTNSTWTTYTGVYTIPAGQGTTVFSFVGISPTGAGGNVLDNIVFSSGSPIAPTPEVTYTSEAFLTSTTKAGYAYGIAEVRGSTVSAVTTPEAYYDPDGSGTSHPEAAISQTPNLGASGWYTTYGTGTSTAFTNAGVITFRNLTPGKTYRIVGVPILAVDTALHVNERPMYVLDEGYYSDVRMPIASEGSADGKEMGNIGVELYRDGNDDRKARISVQNASVALEYALLADTVLEGNKHAPVTATSVTGWQPGIARSVVFEGLALDTTYYLVARISGYEEVTYAAAAWVDDTTSAWVAIRTPALTVTDVAADDVSRDSCTVIRVDNAREDYRYAAIDPVTGEIIGATQKNTTDSITLRFEVPNKGKTYQVMTDGGSGKSWLTGVRAYGCPDTFRVDFSGETVSSSANADGHIPAGTEYIISTPDSVLTDGWVAGTGSRSVMLSENVLFGNTDNVLNLLSRLNADATLRYRLRAGLDGYAGPWMAPVKQVEIPRRRAAPATFPPSYTIEYAAATEAVMVGIADSLAFSHADTTGWTVVKQFELWTFAAAGWGDGASPRAFSVRYPATSTAFASLSGSSTIVARPQLPQGVYLVDNGGGNGANITKVVICGLGSTYEYDYKTSYTYGAGGVQVWKGLTVSKGNSDESDSIYFTPDDVCYLRIRATTTRPASQPVALMANMLGILNQPIYNVAYDYGSTPITKQIYIRNFSSADTFLLKSLTLGGDTGEYYLTKGDTIIAPGAIDSSWSLTPKPSLNAEQYSDTMTMKFYRYANGNPDEVSISLTAKVYLMVNKIEWNMGSISGEIDALRTKSDTLVVKVSGAPPGVTLMYYLNMSSTPVAEGDVGANGDTAFIFTATDHGLKPGATYHIGVRAKPDKNHSSSPTTSIIATGYTAFATPAFDTVARVDYANESIVFRSGYSANSYTVGCASCADREPLSNPTAAGSLTPLLNDTVNDSLTFFIVRKADGLTPASDTGYSNTIAGRAAAPQVTAATVTHASSGTASDGSIRIAGSFEHSYHSAGGSWSPVANTATDLSANDYDVRYRAVAGQAFASQTALATVSAITRQPASFTMPKENIYPENATLYVAIPPTVNTVTYEWYSNNGDSINGGDKISDADSSAYFIGTSTDIGNHYYYCVVTLGGVSTLTSGVATVTVIGEIDTITIDTAYLAPKYYDGTTTATVDSVTFIKKKNKERVTLALVDDYTVDTARFLSPDVGGSDSVLLDVSLTHSLRASQYILANGEKFLLTGQSIEQATPGAAHFDYTPPEDTVYDGDKKVASVAPKPEVSTEMGTISVLYYDYAADTLLPDAPVNVGTYTVKVGVNGGSSFTLDTVAVGQFSIAKKKITINSATVNGKTYDGKDTVTGAVAELEFDGLENGESLVPVTDYTIDSARFDDKNAGSRTAKVYVSLNAGSSTAGNYELTGLPFEKTGVNINKKTIAISAATVAGKTYDGTDTATVTGELTFGGLIAGDALTRNTDYTIDSARFGSKEAGEQTATVYASLIPTGDRAKNYALTGASFEKPDKVSIGKKDVTLDGANSTVAGKPYDGKDSANVDVSVAFVGLAGGDALVPGNDYKVDSARFDSKDVGSQTATVHVSLVENGEKAKNYTLTGAFYFKKSGVSISKREITIIADSATVDSKIYNGRDTATVSGYLTFGNLVPGDTLKAGDDYTMDSARFDSKNAGSRTATVYVALKSSATADRYALAGSSFTKEGRIDQASISIVGATFAGKIYDGTDTANVDDISVAFATLIPGDTLKLGADYTIDSARVDSVHAGSDRKVKVYVTLKTAGTAGSYTLNSNPFEKSGVPITPATLKVTPDKISKLQGDADPELTYTVEGLMNNEKAADVLSGTLIRGYGEVAGSYNIVLGLLEATTDNYTISVVNGSKKFTIRPSCLVTFYSSSDSVGGIYHQKRVPTDSTVTKPDHDPTKTGYAFGGWYNNAAGAGASWDFSNGKVTQDTALYAKWTGGTFYIYYKNTANVNNDNPTQYTVGTTDITLVPLRRDGGYWFTGWYGDSISSPTPVTVIATSSACDITLWARWQKFYTVTFDSRGGNPSTYVDSVAEGGTVHPPASPTKNDSIFGGWYSDSNLSTPWNSSSTVTKDTTVYAKWVGQSVTPKHIVIFIANGSMYLITYVPPGDTVDRPSDPAKTGYSLDGWYSDVSGTADARWDFSTGRITQDTILYALWDTVKYPITYKNVANATHSNPAEYTVESSFELTDAVKAGYRFTGWYADSITSPTPIAAIPRGSTGNITLWARWKALYTVTFDSRGGTPASYTDTVAEGGFAYPPTPNPTKSDYIFDGWYSDSNLSTPWNSSSTVTKDTTVYAKWVGQSVTPKHIVIFIANGSVYLITYVPPGDTVDRPSDPAKTGYSFDGWYSDVSGTADARWDFSTGRITQDTILYALWDTVKYPITYKNVANATHSNPAEYTVESSFELTDAVKAGYRFTGWYADSITSPTPIAAIPRGSTGADTLWARWEASCTVSFNANGDTPDPPSCAVAEGDTAPRPATTPTKNGYSFGGWYKEPDCLHPWNFPTDRVTGNITLYARWIDASVQTYTVAFSTSGGDRIDNQTVVAGEMAISPGNPQRRGYRFAGWHSGVSGPDTAWWYFEACTVTQDTTLYAHWEVIGYRIVYKNADGIANGNPERYTVEDDDVTLSPLSREGYLFTGWYADSVGSWDTVKVIPVSSARDTTLWARWKKLHTVRFSSDGSPIAAYEQQVAHGDTAAAPDFGLVKPGYVFAHWHADTLNPANAWDFGKNAITQDTTLYALWLGDTTGVADSITIDGVRYELTGDAIRHLMECSQQEVSVVASGILADTLRISTSAVVRDTFIHLGGGGEYTLQLVKPFAFDSVARAVLGGKLLIAVNNPANNGGYLFQQAQWWSSAGGYPRLVGSKFYYPSPSGEPITDTTLYVALRDSSGVLFTTCPYASASAPAAPDDPHMSVYPNPAAAGSVIRLKEVFSLIDENLEERYSTLSLLDVQGKTVYTGKASELTLGLVIPDTPAGVYYLILEGKAGRKVIQIAVSN